MAAPKSKTAGIKKAATKAAKSSTVKRAKTAAKKVANSGIKEMEQELASRFANAAESVTPDSSAKSFAKKSSLYLLAGAATAGAIAMFVRYRRGAQI